jgi:DNA-binding NarL/FixJ family response regulator
VSRSVLVVDDDAGFRDLVTRLLSGSGYVVVGEAGSVAQALVCARTLRPYAALVDIGLPDGDGFALAEQLRALPDPARVVLISTDADAASRPTAQRAGACGFLAKDALSGPALRQLIENG